MKKLVLIIVSLMCFGFLQSQNVNKISFHSQLGFERSAYTLREVQAGETFENSKSKFDGNALRFSGYLGVQYADLVRLNLGSSTHITLHEVDDLPLRYYHFVDLYVIIPLDETSQVNLGLTSERYWGFDWRTSQLSTVNFHQYGFGPLIGYQYKNLIINLKYNKFTSNSFDPVGSVNMADTRLSISIGYEFLNIPRRRKKKKEALE